MGERTKLVVRQVFLMTDLLGETHASLLPAAHGVL
jgi:hypothetical protein